MSAIGRIGGKGPAYLQVPGGDRHEVSAPGINSTAVPDFWAAFLRPRAESAIENPLTKYQEGVAAKESRDSQRMAQRRNARASARGGRRSTLLTDIMDEMTTLLGGSSGQKTILGM